MMPASITNEIRKSTMQTMTVLSGTITLGKYTFVMRLAFATSELLDSFNAEENNCQGIVATVTASTASSILPSLFSSERKKLNATRVSKGRIPAQATPIKVCL